MSPTQPIHLLRHLGWRWGVFRLRYMLRRRSGALARRTPITAWQEAPVPAAEALVGRLFGGPIPSGDGAVAEAEEILGGRFQLFSFHRRSSSAVVEWSSNPLTAQRAPTDRHWSELGDFAFGDIKGIWELSRFTWAFTLARAYHKTGDVRYAEHFWQLFSTWLADAPLNAGPNWMCGQEATFRLMGAVFARHVLANAPATTEARLRTFRAFVRATGERIAANLDYALSQSNNHGISECVGALTAAALLPALPAAKHWRTRGLEGLRHQLDALVYADGGFAQHSATYHRVLVHDLLWVRALLHAQGETIPAWLDNAGQRAVLFLATLMNAETGRLPLYGANDGANILPLADADYLDFRPAVQAGAAAFFGERWLAAGPWDEAAAWLAPREVPERRRTFPAHVHLPDAGCFLWRTGGTRLFLRCPTRFRHRPSQADLLHVDVEWRGQRIAHDAGTYSYADTRHPAGPLKDASVHNTLTFDGEEPMQKAGRFLYLPWPKGRAAWDPVSESFTATHDGWKRIGVEHRRTIRTPASDAFEVEDVITGAGSHRARVHWLLGDWPHQFDAAARMLVLGTPAGDFAITWQAPDARGTLVRADPNSARGWWAPYYLHAVPALSLVLEFEFTGEARVRTRFCPLNRSG